MRILIGVVLLLIAGFVGVVVLKEGERRSNAPVGPIPQASEAVVTISKGGAVDIGKKLALTNPLTFFGRKHRTIYVLSNGGIGFQNSARSYTVSHPHPT